MRAKVYKPSMPFYLILLGCAIAIMILLRNCGRNGRELISNSNDTIDISIEYSPFALYTYADTMGGFQYDLLRLLAKRGNLQLKFHPAVALNSSLQGLQTGEYKLLIAQFPITAESRNQFIFTDPVYLDQQVLIQRQDSAGNIRIGSQLELGKKNVYVVKDSPMEERLYALSHEIGDTIYVKQEAEYGAEQLAIMVSNGVIDYAVINSRLAQQFAKDMPNLNLSTKISFTQFQSWALPKSEIALRDSLNKWLKEIKPTQEYKNLYNRYFNK